MAKKSSHTASFVIQNAILSFPKLFQPEQINGTGRSVYGASFLIDAATASMITQKAQELALGHFTNGETNNPKFHYPVELAANKYMSTGQKLYDRVDLQDKYVISAKANAEFPPQVVGTDRQPILDRGQIYAGAIVAASINLFTFQVQNGGIGISIGLKAVMKQGDGEPMGAVVGVDVNQEFADVQTFAAPAGAVMPNGMPAPQAMPTPAYNPAMPAPAYQQAGMPATGMQPAQPNVTTPPFLQ